MIRVVLVAGGGKNTTYSIRIWQDEAGFNDE